MFEEDVKGFKGLVMGFIILVIVIGFINAILYNSVDRDKAKSIAKDYNGEMQGLIERSKSCRQDWKKEELYNDIEDYVHRVRELEDVEREYIDNELYRKLINVKSSLERYKDNRKEAREKVVVLNVKIKALDENFDMEKDISQAEYIVKTFKSLPSDISLSVENMTKYNKIEDRYYEYLANKVEELIDGIGEVKYDEDCKDKLYEVGKAYRDLATDAKRKVENKNVFDEKLETYYKLEDEATGSHSDMFEEDLGMLEWYIKNKK